MVHFTKKSEHSTGACNIYQIRKQSSSLRNASRLEDHFENPSNVFSPKPKSLSGRDTSMFGPHWCNQQRLKSNPPPTKKIENGSNKLQGEKRQNSKVERERGKRRELAEGRREEREGKGKGKKKVIGKRRERKTEENRGNRNNKIIWNQILRIRRKMRGRNKKQSRKINQNDHAVFKKGLGFFNRQVLIFFTFRLMCSTYPVH